MVLDLKKLEKTHNGKEHLRKSPGNLQIEIEDLDNHRVPRDTRCGWYMESGVSDQVWEGIDVRSRSQKKAI